MLSVCWAACHAGLAEKSLNFSNGLDEKGSLSDTWISFLLFLDKMNISENIVVDCVVVALESEAFAKNFIKVLFCWENWWE